MEDKAIDVETGIAISFIRGWAPEPFGGIHDRAFMLAMQDPRACSFMDKLASAYQFLSTRSES